MGRVYNVSISRDSQRNTAVLTGDPSRGGSRGLCLNDGDSLQLSIDTSTFPASTVFQGITFFPTSDETGNGVTLQFPTNVSPCPPPPPTSARKVWGTPNAPRSGSVDLFTVTWNTTDLRQPLVIADIEGGSTVQDSAWFAITLYDPSQGASWVLDPELVNTSGNQVGWQPAQGATLSRVAVAAV